MFFGMTAWIFFRRRDRLSVIVAWLMVLLGTQCLLSMWFIFEGVYYDKRYWTILTSIDIVAVPFYALILRELVRPLSVTWKACIANISPFALMAAINCFAPNPVVDWLMMAGAGIYGVAYLIWTYINIGIYNRHLKEIYSYTDEINLDWLYKILWFFFALLLLWVVDTLLARSFMDWFYLLASMVMWMTIDYFIYMHETAMESLNAGMPDIPDIIEEEESVAAPMSELGSRIERIFAEEMIFLNPNLKITDVAVAVGSNRTYVSRYFNKEISASFYDYVNGLRIEHACRLLKETDMSVKAIAEQSGYNSPQTFIRVFVKTKGVSPTEFRTRTEG